MKKILIILITASLLIVGSASFAQELYPAQDQTREKGRYSQANRKDQKKDFAARAKEKQDLINRQRAEIKELRQRLNTQIKQIKTQVNNLKKQNSSLDAAKINTIKQTIVSVKEAHQALDSTQDAISRKNNDLRNARQHRRPEAFLRGLDGVIEIQQKRIDYLTRIVSDLDKLISELG